MLIPVLLLALAGCGTPKVSGLAGLRPCAIGASCASQGASPLLAQGGPLPARSLSPKARGTIGPIERSLVEMDDFQGMLVRAGVPPVELPVDGRRLLPEEASRLLSRLLTVQVSLSDFGPWRMAVWLLLEASQSGAPVSREQLEARLRRFQPILVLRPDGYLVKATSGQAVQHVGPVQLQRLLLLRRMGLLVHTASSRFSSLDR